MIVKKIVSDLAELYKKLLNPKNQEESIELSSMDFYLDVLEEQANANRKRIAELGFWTENGEYKEDYQEIDENDTL